MSQKALIVVTVWKETDFLENSSRVREFGFQRFSAIIKTNAKIDIYWSYSNQSE